VRIDGVEREIGSWRKFEHFGSDALQLAAQGFVLSRGECEIGLVMKSKFAPAA
jgi:hypothetical protein